MEALSHLNKNVLTKQGVWFCAGGRVKDAARYIGGLDADPPVGGCLR